MSGVGPRLHSGLHDQGPLIQGMGLNSRSVSLGADTCWGQGLGAFQPPLHYVLKQAPVGALTQSPQPSRLDAIRKSGPPKHSPGQSLGLGGRDGLRWKPKMWFHGHTRHTGHSALPPRIAKAPGLPHPWVG